VVAALTGAFDDDAVARAAAAATGDGAVALFLFRTEAIVRAVWSARINL
jgi:hypothetical protein